MVDLEIVPHAGDPSWSSSWRPLDVATRQPVLWQAISPAGFTFEFFQVNVTLNVTGVELGHRGPGLPGVDFALMLHAGLRELRSATTCRIAPSLTQDEIELTQDGDLITWTQVHHDAAGKSRGRAATMSQQEYAWLVRECLTQVVRLLTGAHPVLVSNPYVAWLSTLPDETPPGPDQA